MNVGTVNAQDVKFDPYFLLNLTAGYKFNEHLQLQASVKNLLDQRYEYPEYIRQKVRSVPGGPGISFYGMLKMSY